MKKIEQTYKIKVPIDKVWEAFFDPEIIEKWGGGPAKMSAKEKAEFSLWGGDIHGTNTEIIPLKLLKQGWYGHAYNKPERCYKVTFTFSSDGDMTTVHLLHSDIPDDEVKDFEYGWKNYYIGAIKELLEN